MMEIEVSHGPRHKSTSHFTRRAETMANSCKQQRSLSPLFPADQQHHVCPSRRCPSRLHACARTVLNSMRLLPARLRLHCGAMRFSPTLLETETAHHLQQRCHTLARLHTMHCAALRLLQDMWEVTWRLPRECLRQRRRTGRCEEAAPWKRRSFSEHHMTDAIVPRCSVTGARARARARRAKWATWHFRHAPRRGSLAKPASPASSRRGVRSS